MRQREYDSRKEALDALLEEKLLEKEAKARGLTVEELKAREVDQKAEKADKAEVEQLYQQNQRRLAGVPREQALLTVERAVLARNREMRLAGFRRELAKKHGVTIRLEPPRYDVSIPADAPTLGPKSAPVTIVEFADYQCPFCHQAQQAVEEILKRYSGKVRFVHRDFPLESIHPRATPAARASRCAGEQGKFWEYHRGLLAAAGDLSDADLKNRAQGLGLNLTTFDSCLAQPGGEKPVQASLEEGMKLGVAATPTFFVNGRRLVGAKNVPDFVDVIEDELARAGR
jgi:protein-disulfide isomerase